MGESCLSTVDARAGATDRYHQLAGDLRAAIGRVHVLALEAAEGDTSLALRNVWIGSELPGRVCAFEFCHVCVAAGVSVTTAPEIPGASRPPATLKTLLPNRGGTTMWRTLPELPADATTMIPAFSALVEARESADWSVPKLLRATC